MRPLGGVAVASLWRVSVYASMSSKKKKKGVASNKCDNLYRILFFVNLFFFLPNLMQYYNYYNNKITRRRRQHTHRHVEREGERLTVVNGFFLPFATRGSECPIPRIVINKFIRQFVISLSVYQIP